MYAALFTQIVLRFYNLLFCVVPDNFIPLLLSKLMRASFLNYKNKGQEIATKTERKQPLRSYKYAIFGLKIENRLVSRYIRWKNLHNF